MTTPKSKPPKNDHLNSEHYAAFQARMTAVRAAHPQAIMVGTRADGREFRCSSCAALLEAEDGTWVHR